MASIWSEVTSPGGTPVFFSDSVTIAYPGTLCGNTLRFTQFENARLSATAERNPASSPASLS